MQQTLLLLLTFVVVTAALLLQPPLSESINSASFCCVVHPFGWCFCAKAFTVGPKLFSFSVVIVTFGWCFGSTVFTVVSRLLVAIRIIQLVGATVLSVVALGLQSLRSFHAC